MMKAWFCFLVVAPMALIGSLAQESSCHAAAANLVVVSTNPNGAPTNGGTQFLLGIQVTDISGPTYLGSNLVSFTGNVGNATPTAPGTYYTADKALFQSEADLANGIGGYLRTNDSYFASPFQTLIASPNGAGETVPMRLFIDLGVYGSGPFQVPSNGTYPFAYVNVTGSPGVDITGEFAIGTTHAVIGNDPATGVRLTPTGQLKTIGALDGDYNADGTVNAADYVLLRKGGPLQNDPTPGVQPADYDFWRSRFGETMGAGAGVGTAPTAVPEPSSMGLLAIAIWCNHGCRCGGWLGARANT